MGRGFNCAEITKSKFEQEKEMSEAISHSSVKPFLIPIADVNEEQRKNTIWMTLVAGEMVANEILRYRGYRYVYPVLFTKDENSKLKAYVGEEFCGTCASLGYRLNNIKTDVSHGWLVGPLPEEQVAKGKRLLDVFGNDVSATGQMHFTGRQFITEPISQNTVLDAMGEPVDESTTYNIVVAAEVKQALLSQDDNSKAVMEEVIDLVLHLRPHGRLLSYGFSEYVFDVATLMMPTRCVDRARILSRYLDCYGKILSQDWFDFHMQIPSSEAKDCLVARVPCPHPPPRYVRGVTKSAGNAEFAQTYIEMVKSSQSK